MRKEEVFKKVVIRDIKDGFTVDKLVEVASLEDYEKYTPDYVVPESEIQVKTTAELLSMIKSQESLRKILAGNVYSASKGKISKEEAEKALLSLTVTRGFVQRLLSIFKK